VKLLSCISGVLVVADISPGDHPDQCCYLLLLAVFFLAAFFAFFFVAMVNSFRFG